MHVHVLVWVGLVWLWAELLIIIFAKERRNIQQYIYNKYIYTYIYILIGNDHGWAVVFYLWLGC